MLSKILPFNRTLLKKDWTIHKWMILVVAVIFLLVGPYATWTKISEFFSSLENAESFEYISFYQLSRRNLINRDFLLLMMFVFPVIVSSMMIGEEKRRRTVEISIGGPYSRYQVFFNKMVMGIAAISLPVLLSGLILQLMVIGSSQVGMLLTSHQVLLWVFKCSMIGIAMFSFATLMGMLCSSFLIQGFFTLVFALFPIGFVSILEENMVRWGFYMRASNEGFDKIIRAANSITPGYYFGRLIEMDSIKALPYGLTMLGISILIMVVSGVLFDIYAVERGPEALTFIKTEAFIRAGIVVCSVLLGGLMISEMINDDGSFGLISGYLLGGVLGYFIPKAIIARNRVA